MYSAVKRLKQNRRSTTDLTSRMFVHPEREYEPVRHLLVARRVPARECVAADRTHVADPRVRYGFSCETRQGMASPQPTCDEGVRVRVAPYHWGR